MPYTNDQMRGFVTDAESEIDALMQQLQNDEIDIDQFEDEFQSLLTSYHLASYMLGQDGEEITDEQLEDEANNIQEQLVYAANFILIMKSAIEWGSDWFARARMYASAFNRSYWMGNMYGIPVPAQIGQGSQCLTNCWCAWRIHVLDENGDIIAVFTGGRPITTFSPVGDYDCFWELDPQVENHCQTCIQRNRDWYPIRIRGGILQV